LLTIFGRKFTLGKNNIIHHRLNYRPSRDTLLLRHEEKSKNMISL
jgi:hypothetical protein